MHELAVKCDFLLVTLDDLLVWKSRGKLPVMLSFFLSCFWIIQNALPGERPFRNLNVA